MLKPAGARCNLGCRYCYYLDKAKLYPEVAPSARMSEEVLEEAVRQYIESQPTREVIFVWHGGEPTLLPLSFYRKVMQLQRKYAQGRLISNCLQTNGTLLTPEWCQFLHDHEWLVGISMDGTEDMHDAFRRTRGGESTYNQVMSSVRLLRQYDVQWNAMAVVNSRNVEEPERFYRHLKEIGVRYLQFAPIVERDASGQVTAESVSPEQWGRFCIGLFDEWLRQEDVGRIFVQLFDATLANWMEVVPGVCTLGRQCGHALVMEWNGDVYSCDHFVDADHYLGNILHRPLYEMIEDPKQSLFGTSKETSLPAACRQCPYLSLCGGECLKNRLEDGRNYLCAGYRMFFEHSAPVMNDLKRELLFNQNN